MRVLSRDLKHGYVKLVPETLDDLWHLLNLIRPGNLVSALTSREVKVREATGETSKGKRFPMYLGLRVEDLQLDRYVKRLRVKGMVVHAPERFEHVVGNYHAINVRVGETLEVVKEKWMDSELRRLEDASKTRRVNLTILAIDNEDCCIALLREYGFDVKAEWKVRLPGKLQPDQHEAALTSYFKEALANLEQSLEEKNGVILLVGPGFIKQRFQTYAVQHVPDLAAIMRVANVSSGGLAGVYEALRAGLVTKYASEARAVVEAKLVDEAFLRLSRGGDRVTYGREAVEEASNYGAVETLLVSDRVMREMDEEQWSSLMNLIERVEKKAGKAVFISSETEAGEKLYSLGGLLAMLRFPVHRSQ